MRHPVRTAKRQLLRFGSCVLSALLALSSVPVSAVDNGVSPVYDEAYYAMTDYYGNLTEGSVVKSYLTNGYSTLTDYGQYDEVLNLTDGTVPSSAGGMTTFRFDAGTAPSHFYFEGKTTRPFEALPWTLAVSYKLNGVPTRRKNRRCGNQSGRHSQPGRYRVRPEQLHAGGHGHFQSGRYSLP